MTNTRKLHFLFLFSLIVNIYGSAHTGFNSPIQSDQNITSQIDLTLPSTDSKKQKSRMRKQKNKKPRGPATYREMNKDLLTEATKALDQTNNISSRIKYREQLIKLSDPEDALTISQYLLEIADLLFANEQYEEAEQRYAEFALLHSGSEKIEYILYRAIISSFNCTLPSDRDQTKTEQTLQRIESFLEKDHFVAHTHEVIAIQNECFAKLIESELTTCSFYINRGSYKSAQKRITHLRTHWLAKCPSYEADIAQCEQDLLESITITAQKAEKKLLAHNKASAKTKKRLL